MCLKLIVNIVTNFGYLNHDYSVIVFKLWLRCSPHEISLLYYLGHFQEHFYFKFTVDLHKEKYFDLLKTGILQVPILVYLLPDTDFRCS